MSCVTCRDVTLPTTHTLTDGWTPGPIPPKRHGPGHVGHRLGDTIPGHIVVIWRGRDVSLQAVEAYTGDMDTGWAEIRMVNEDGAPITHPAQEVCSTCGEPRDYAEEPRCEGAHWKVTIPAHVQTVIRAGQVTVIHGTHITTG